MNMKLNPFALFTLLTLTPGLHAIAQEKSSDGHALEWKHTLEEQPAHLTVNRHKFSGWSFPVYECSPGEAMQHWKKHMTAQGAEVKSNEPMRATGGSITGLASQAPVTFATAVKDKKTGTTRVTVVFALNDSTAAPEDPTMIKAVHEMAVHVNRAVVQAQIAAQEKRVKKTAGQLEDAQKDEAKASERASDAGKDLENVKQKQSKLSQKQADLRKEIDKWQTRYNATQNPKDLKKLTKVQEKLAGVNSDLAKEMRSESKVQGQLNKHQEAIPDARKDERKHGAQKDLANSQLEALKRKLDAIR
jgi:predicted  nucleic acid-binding Zn-ribbon protein